MLLRLRFAAWSGCVTTIMRSRTRFSAVSKAAKAAVTAVLAFLEFQEQQRAFGGLDVAGEVAVA